MYSKFINKINNALLIPSASYTIFELGKNYNNIKNSIQNNNMIKNIYLNIKNNSPFK